MRRLLPLLAIAAAEYDGACDGQAFAQTAMTIAAGATYTTFYQAKYSDTTCGSSGGSLYSYGTTMNYESLNCGVDVCARCVQGVLTLGYFPDGAPDALWSDTTDASFTGTATAIASRVPQGWPSSDMAGRSTIISPITTPPRAKNRSRSLSWEKSTRSPA